MQQAHSYLLVRLPSSSISPELCLENLAPKITSTQLCLYLEEVRGSVWGESW